LITKLKNIEFDDDYKLFSLDVVSMFINIPIKLAVNSIKKRWHLIKNNTSIPYKEFLIGIRLILNSTYFKFNNKIYKQSFGIPMGSSLSPLVADLVIQDIETEVLGLLPEKLPFYFRYVDDIVILSPIRFIDRIFQCFNSYHIRIKFTLEIGTDRINFLDVTIIMNNNRFIFDWPPETFGFWEVS